MKCRLDVENITRVTATIPSSSLIFCRDYGSAKRNEEAARPSYPPPSGVKTNVEKTRRKQFRTILYEFASNWSRFTDFKREHGFRDAPSMGENDGNGFESPYHIPVLGQEMVERYNDRSSRVGGEFRSTYGDAANDDFDGGENKYYRGGSVGLGLDDDGLDDRYRGPGLFANMFNGDGYFGAAAAGDDGGFDFEPSPFQYHHDVSSTANGLKGDGHGFDEQVRKSYRRQFRIF